MTTGPKNGLRKGSVSSGSVIYSTGSYVVTRGTGRRQLRAEFGCDRCPVKVALPACRCRTAAVAHARLLGEGAVVERAGVVIERIGDDARLAG